MININLPGYIAGLRYSKTAGLNGWVNLPNRLSISYNLGCDWTEQEIAHFGPFMLTQAYTEAEIEEMNEEAAFMDAEANRYTEWSY